MTDVRIEDVRVRCLELLIAHRQDVPVEEMAALSVQMASEILNQPSDRKLSSGNPDKD